MRGAFFMKQQQQQQLVLERLRFIGLGIKCLKLYVFLWPCDSSMDLGFGICKGLESSSFCMYFFLILRSSYKS